MQYRRKESFRFTFQPPEKATLFIRQEEESGTVSYEVELVDISGHGARIFSPIRMDHLMSHSEVTLSVKLHAKELVLKGEVAWKKPSRDGTLIGAEFQVDQKAEADIMQELKLRRHKELQEEYRKQGKRLY
ncbi:PilZ domain-containing protein [Paenisporosarcina cavernae]|uniref:PilZ domain-containing protein n=1 Tax=Paenisporosarcina cavernae TaxID=2320858 RepID=UPI0013C4AD66|nr:PilZ domain-containing protein [Paenisporosarcina cavernae]